ncbi:unnamed protein product [Blepharisma stoltei]|uniref:Peptidase S49 domain-containing protein n=1 Tax=Blepharisma stoltei TaxID=1481888 RepID=A0AAU9JVY4_9CILI|nr:unnamed protein product [Blepharisma stoltei]
MIGRFISKLRSPVVHFRITGDITEVTTKRVQAHMKKLSYLTPKLLAVSVNSCRGSFVQAEIISDTFKKFSLSKECPFYTFAEDYALGPGYCLLSSGHQAFADIHSILGGISTSFQQLGLQQFAKDFSIEPVFIAAGKNKVRLNPFEKVKQEDEKWIKQLLNSRQELMKKHVLSHRKNLQVTPQNEKEILGGEIYSAKKAIDVGLIDGVKEISSFAEQEFPGVKTWYYKVTGKERRFVARGEIEKWIENANQGYLSQEEILELMNEICQYGLSHRMEAKIN